MSRVIRASEINQYLFCAKAWWLGAIEGIRPSNVHELSGGSLAHARHGRTVAVAGITQRIALGVLLVGLALALIWFSGGAG
jgi:hypothetical protein